ncbi:hypothetical protein E3P81_02791 [Wallemia ichthyophaga]|uniref:Uncharacterized protein n=1 Tax=Wallemia ichthyophaga TaxID=245174 RepID=A0A4T0KMP7_WALIC|nr:hypothetical protein E3P97_02912 [Wallemia ichthyophaga]TIB28402.1 hypothetical protein E3P85_03682 [Wallemia ichthyophaga]TIB40565.1 hypothetical protein E3P86_00629 [Wallemia ichthyophaga]TIB45443.1 hypothetical protein E3P82_02841 [Wallemia ichthyophaga]TIB48630.1 hypothetical protein E3P81_02791 [Wallemia ichthyophaga]
MSFSTISSNNSSSDSGLLSPPPSHRSDGEDSNNSNGSVGKYNMTLQSYSASLCGYHLAAVRKATNAVADAQSKSLSPPLSNLSPSKPPRSAKKDKAPIIAASLVMHKAQQDRYNEKF